MSTGKWNIAADQGSTFYRSITWYGPDIATPKDNPRDITDYIFHMQVRAGPDEPVLLEITTENGRATIPTGTDGVTILEVSQAAMLAMPYGKWYHDAQWIAPSGEVKRLVKGFFCNDASITKDTAP